MDKFKQYLQQHNDDLGNDEPRDLVWKNIQQQLPVTTSKPAVVIKFIRYAVAACVIALAGVGAYHLLDNKKEVAIKENLAVVTKPAENVEPSTTNSSSVTLPDKEVIDEPVVKTKKDVTIKKSTPSPSKKIIEDESIYHLQTMEMSFHQIINIETSKINGTPLYTESPGYFSDFKLRLKQMENDEALIKKDIARNGLTDELLNQLINLYQQKLNVLKALQNEINKTNNRFKQNHNPADSTTQTYFLNI
jgi:hypothetical protein